MARKYSKSAGKDVERAVKKEKKGTLRSGKGGKGGDGGPGGGGPSIPLVVSGAEPTTFALDFDPGPGGVGALGAEGARGATGESMDSKVIASPTVNPADAGTD